MPAPPPPRAPPPGRPTDRVHLPDQIYASAQAAPPRCDPPGANTTSLLGCPFLGTTECIVLTLMAFDRYVAVRWPLHHATPA
ncbi:Hypothetical predicted protein [Lynx pardinus]|uniref:Uncharacterized protein n=1 Tax=Lynx pardinus TaxID=191816 RepID=A0A485P4N8_LYNPA|nr:Hypothetical predicted protein [Lynx pardinus]